MTVAQLYAFLDKRIPCSLSCEWDNDGLMCCPDPSREVSRVLVALDVTEDVVDRALEGGYDLIVSHHPIIFKGMKRVTEQDFSARKLIKLIRAGISVFSFHTRLDAVDGGVNDTLASLIGLENVTPFGDEGIGRIGELTECVDAQTLAKRVKDVLGADGVYLADACRPCRRVAVLGGNGGDDTEAAIAAGADTYISGELKFHSMTDARDMGVNLIEAGHFFTELPVCQVLVRMLCEIDPSLTCDTLSSNRITLVN